MSVICLRGGEWNKSKKLRLEQEEFPELAEKEENWYG